MAREFEVDAAVVGANLSSVRNQIAAAAKRAGRDPKLVKILAAVKYISIDQLPVLAAAGIELVGENRAQDLAAKADRYPGLFYWHFIGQLQSRKVKQILPHVELIHSVASESALRQLDLHRSDTTNTKILLEVNVSGEEGKAGIHPADLERYIELSPVEVVGLMTMPPYAEDPESSRRFFRELRELADRFGLSELSMGTSQDYAVAVQEGSTIVRLGSVLYDKRDKKRVGSLS